MSFVEEAVVEQVEEVVKTKKVRQPKLDADGNPIVKAPKLDADGNPIVKAPKAPKLDADGNPIQRKTNTYLPNMVIRYTDKVLNFREGTKRHTNFAAIVDGMTVEAYKEAVGAEWRTFLVWFCESAGLVTVDTE